MDSEKLIDLESFCADFSKELANLNAENRNARKKGLAKLYENIVDFKSVTKVAECAISESEMELLSSNIIKPIIEIIKSDPTERCRELAAEILLVILSDIKCIRTSDCQDFIPIIIKCLNGPEDSEEIRLLYLRILKTVLTYNGLLNNDLKKSVISTLSLTLMDDYAETLKESCDCLINFANRLNENDMENDDFSLEPFVKILCNLLKHRQGKVRITAIRTLGVLMKTDFKRLSKHTEEITQSLGQCIAKEESSSVREAFTEVIGELMHEILCLEYHSAYLLRFLPLVLTTISDPIENIRNKANASWMKTGEKYFKIHEKSFSDYVEHYPDDSLNYHEHKIMSRPNKGCRRMVSLHLRGILPAVLNELNDNWSEITRDNSISLLHQLLRHGEESCIPHLYEIFTSLIKFQANLLEIRNNKIAIEHCKNCCIAISCLASSTVWSEVLFPIITSYEESHVKILSAAIWILLFTYEQSTHCEEIWKKTNALLVHKKICQSSSHLVKEPLILLMESIVQEGHVLPVVAEEDTYDPFVILTTIGALMEKQFDVHEKVKSLLSTLSSLPQGPQGMDKKCIYELHFQKFLNDLTVTHELWELSTPELTIFEYLIKVTPSRVLMKSDDKILDIITRNISDRKEPLQKLVFYTILSKFLEKTMDLEEPPTYNLNDLSKHLIENVFLPQLELATPGLSANSLKSAVLNCLLTLINRKWFAIKCNNVETTWMENFVSKLTPVISNLLNSSESALCRSISCKVIGDLFKLNSLAKAESLKMNWILLQKELIARLEFDVNNDVRSASCESLGIMCSMIFREKIANFMDTEKVIKVAMRELEMSKTQGQQRKVVENLLQKVGILNPKLFAIQIEQSKDIPALKDTVEKFIQQFNSIQL